MYYKSCRAVLRPVVFVRAVVTAKTFVTNVQHTLTRRRLYTPAGKYAGESVLSEANRVTYTREGFFVVLFFRIVFRSKSPSEYSTLANSCIDKEGVRVEDVNTFNDVSFGSCQSRARKPNRNSDKRELYYGPFRGRREKFSRALVFFLRKKKRIGRITRKLSAEAFCPGKEITGRKRANPPR